MALANPFWEGGKGGLPLANLAASPQGPVSN